MRKPTQAKAIVNRLMTSVQIDRARSNREAIGQKVHARAERLRKHVALMKVNQLRLLVEFHCSEFARKVGASGVAVYGHLIVRSCGKPYAYPSVKHMAEDLGMDKRTVRRAINRLMSYSLIMRTPRNELISQALGIRYKRHGKYVGQGWLYWLNDWDKWDWDGVGGVPTRLLREYAKKAKSK